ncbi:unnamed protein product [Caenorhabditis auriculariae]|uniref:Uncharacterized protein n=1 Tax=Caenorhabditis auriculariae TaxID=2777116 RepID=A0A8S1H864_9PELO|nr:unnamed protein product [Caenorhabditis auriculariae]
MCSGDESEGGGGGGGCGQKIKGFDRRRRVQQLPPESRREHDVSSGSRVQTFEFEPKTSLTRKRPGSKIQDPNEKAIN